MNTTIKTGFAAILLFAISCKKENSNLQSPLTANDASAMVAGKYDHVKIGTQVWMSTNLDVTYYRNGDKIPQVKDSVKWARLTTGAWCWYNNDSAAGAVYGKLYNWYAVNDPRGLAPIGWHIPSDTEWDTLSARLGGASKAGGKLKDTGTIEAGTGLWHFPNRDATNKTGFTGLPAGFRYIDGTFNQIGFFGYWYSSTEYDINYAWSRFLRHDYGYFTRSSNSKQIGFSVRCLRD